MLLNYIYKFDMNTLFSKKIDNGILKCSTSVCDRAKKVVSKRDSLLIEQINQLKDDNTKLEEILCIIDFSNFIKSHSMNYLSNIKEIELKIKLLDGENETKKEKTIIVKDFLKSNSMSKECQVYYINSKVISKNGSNLYEEIIPRVFFDFNNQETTLSKLYSYSGTVCSDCNLLDNIKLNEDEVVVVSDKNFIVKADCITMISKEFLYTELKRVKWYLEHYKDYSIEKILGCNACVEFDSLYKSMNDSCNNISEELKIIIGKYYDVPKNNLDSFEKGISKLERIIARDYPFDLNLFDGEGLISTEFCDEIRKSLCNKLGTNKYKNSTSFQIRLPYVKGMVHSCDIKRFFKEKNIEFLSHTTYCGDKKYDVNKIKMVLTESQFKLITFIKDKNSYIKTISDYINTINKFNYSFGVIDANKEEKSNCALEYQFMSTLPLNKDDILKIYNDVYFDINNECTKEKIIQSLSEEDTVFSKEELEMYNLNSDFYFSTQRYSDRRNKIFNRLKEKALFSKFNVHGTRRYLSSNLLELLYHIAYEDDANYPKSEWLDKYQFYMPTKLKHNNYAVFLRSPHYARNEIVLLNRRPFILNKELEEYFSHLTGIVMINPRSLAADRLGGADFDGDTVLVVNDKKIFSPVTRDLIEYENYNINYKYLPCKIPSLKGQDMKYNDYSHRLICLDNTFSSRVGALSNEAIMRASKIYNSSDLVEHSIISEYTILNGLEIDSAKTGKKPKLEKISDEEKDSLIGKFLELKKKYDKDKTIDGVGDFLDALPTKVYDIKYEYNNNETINYGYNVLSIMLNMKRLELMKEKDESFAIETGPSKDKVKTLAIALIYSNFNKLYRRVFTSKAKKINEVRLTRLFEQLIIICKNNNIDLEKLLDNLNLDNIDAFNLVDKYVKDGNYHYLLDKENRKEYLNDLFNGKYIESYEALINFDNDGFRLLFLVLNYFANTLSTIKLISSPKEEERINNKINEFSDEEKSRFNDLYGKYEKHINKLISSKKNEGKEKELKTEIVDYLKEEAKTLTIDDINSTIKITSSNMVFDVFFDIIKEYMEVSNG